jgi:ABC-type branched-subunit amino acid transport system ATPase component
LLVAIDCVNTDHDKSQNDAKRIYAITDFGRKVFSRFSVLDNLRRVGNHLEAVMDAFPHLHERRSQLAGTLSGESNRYSRSDEP